jgi:hypothetical protein
MSLLLILILTSEGFVLYKGQRLLFDWSLQLLGRGPAYFLAVPGTVLHELAHLIACKVLLVPTGRVALFNPSQGPDGSVTLGYVEHYQSDTWRSAVVGMAPLLLVPPLLLGISILLLGGQVIHEPLAALTGAAWWRVALWAYIAISTAQGTFPSPGDHVPVAGAAGLAALGLIVGLSWPQGTTLAVLVLALPVLMVGLYWLALRALMYRRGLKPARG